MFYYLLKIRPLAPFLARDSHLAADHLSSRSIVLKYIGGVTARSYLILPTNNISFIARGESITSSEVRYPDNFAAGSSPLAATCVVSVLLPVPGSASWFFT
jgi:hypothetical protein